MRRRGLLHLTTLGVALLALARTPFAQVPTTESHFGFRLGSDRQLAGAPEIEAYFEQVAARSDRVRIVDIGSSTEGHRTIAAIISAPDNIRNLEQIRTTNQRLANPATLAPDEARRLAAGHKVVLTIGAGIHASEIDATQAATELLQVLATSSDPETTRVLDNVVVILIPMLNPDGHRLVVAWNQTTRNTPFDGAPMPWLYHKYAGHEINRDAFMLNLAESRNLARFFYTTWHPQVFLSMHQMDSAGPRMFVPPVADPIDRNYDPLIWREAALLGSAMALELQRDGRSGVVSNALYDYYWPGYEDSAPLGHNTVGLLTEVANPDMNTPAAREAAREPRTRNGPADQPSVAYPDPWRGGRWTSRDVVDYHLSAVRGLLGAAASYRELIVRNFVDVGRRAVDLGEHGGPFAFIIPPDQYDPHAAAKLEELLVENGVDIHRALEPFRADGEPYPAGADIILLAQPYRAFVKTLLERQNYPERTTPRRATSRPYDVVGWTLPAQMGVDVRTIERIFEPPAMSRLTALSVAPARIWGDAKASLYFVDARGNGGVLAMNRLVAAGIQPSWVATETEVNGYSYPPGSLVVPAAKGTRPVAERIASELGLRIDGVQRKMPGNTQPVGMARVALYKPWLPNADEGWTRWLLDRYQFRYTSISDADVRGANLRQRFDVIILPSAPVDQLKAGNRDGLVPAAYVGGLDDSGVAALKAFVESGGTLVCLDEAGELVIDEFRLPVRDAVRDLSPSEFFCPGSIVKVDLDPLQPLAFGMPPHTAGVFRFSSAYVVETRAAGGTDGAAAGAVTVVAKYADKDLLVSGLIEGEQAIAGKPAALDVRVGTGHVILLGFSTQHRAQSHATFRLLFNSIFTAPQGAIAASGNQ